jgi:ribulose-5-phosphate 4-epimerase/fuculose-1-phosphate aldolase
MSREYAIKLQLAQAYQILAHLGLDDHTYTHLSARADNNSYYIYPFGLRFAEVTPENLLKVSLDGEIIEGEEFQYNRTGYIIHGNIYLARTDINAVFHLHSPEIVAVSACKHGLQPLSQWALHFYEKMSYHAYNSLALDHSQGEQLIRDLGTNFNILLQNHGSINCGRTIHEAMFYSM